MPIYSYRCDTCGHAKDVLQKMSDPQLTVCPACGAATFKKQLTAAGFQLKGSGWYVTDFRDGNAGKKAPDSPANGEGEKKTALDNSSGAQSGPAGGDTAAAPAKSTAAPVAAPASSPPAPSSLTPAKAVNL